MDERVDRLVDRALERVLERHDRAVDVAAGDGQHDLADRRQRHVLGVAAGARRGAQRRLAERPRRARGSRRASRVTRLTARCSASGTSPRERRAQRLLLLGRERHGAAPVDDLLGVEPRLVAVVDRGQHDPGAAVVEQRDRRRLAARHLVVGVVADDRPVGDRAVEAPLGALEPALEARHDVDDVVVQRGELALDVGGMGDEVALAVAEHDALVGAHAPQAPRRDHRRRTSADERQRERAQRDNPDVLVSSSTRPAA